MSTNLSLTFEPDSDRVHNIQDIHTQKDETKRDEIYAAANAFLKEEGLLEQNISCTLWARKATSLGTLRILSSAWLLVSLMSRQGADSIGMAVRVLGLSCKPAMVVEYPDED